MSAYETLEVRAVFDVALHVDDPRGLAGEYQDYIAGAGAPEAFRLTDCACSLRPEFRDGGNHESRRFPLRKGLK